MTHKNTVRTVLSLLTRSTVYSCTSFTRQTHTQREMQRDTDTGKVSSNVITLGTGRRYKTVVSLSLPFVEAITFCPLVLVLLLLKKQLPPLSFLFSLLFFSFFFTCLVIWMGKSCEKRKRRKKYKWKSRNRM